MLRAAERVKQEAIDREEEVVEALISVLVVLVLLVLIVVLYSKFVVKDNTLDSLEMLPGEEVLFEEDGVDVEQVGAQQPVVYDSCKIRVTNLRLLIAQKVIFSEKMALRYVISYTDPEGEGADMGRSVRSAYLVASIPHSQIVETMKDGKPVLAIPLGGGALTGHQTAHLHSARLSELLGALDKGVMAKK